jgi:hypothetical protein
MAPAALTIVSLEAENIKRLVAVQITPDGSLVQITGKNGQGKTSVLDSLWWALAGRDAMQVEPIRRGEERARIRLDLGTVVITRTFERVEEGGFTTKITAETAEGARFPSPQKMLDAIVGDLSFDPLAFQRAKPAAQFNMLRGFVPEVDFEAIEAAHRDDFSARTEVNRNAKQARAAAEAITFPEDTPAEPIALGPLMEVVQEVATHNGEIEARVLRRERVQADAATYRFGAEESRKKAGEIRERIKRLHLESIEADAEGARLDGLAEEKEGQLAAAGPLPEPWDATEARAAVERAQEVNAAVERRQRQAQLLATAEEEEAESLRLTKAIEDRNADKAKKIAAAKLPVPGLGFGDGAVTWEGLPFDQASDAQQLRASIGIAMAMNPRLRVIRVRDGNSLDSDGLRMVEELAQSEGYQVWIERVEESGAIGFVIEDGLVKGQPDPFAAPVLGEKPLLAAPKRPAKRKAKLPEEGGLL